MSRSFTNNSYDTCIRRRHPVVLGTPESEEAAALTMTLDAAEAARAPIDPGEDGNAIR